MNRGSTQKFILSFLTGAASMLVASGLKHAASLSAMYSYLLITVSLLGIATCLAGMAVMDAVEEERIRQMRRKIHRPAEHTVKPGKRKVG